MHDLHSKTTWTSTGVVGYDLSNVMIQVRGLCIVHTDEIGLCAGVGG